MPTSSSITSRINTTLNDFSQLLWENAASYIEVCNYASLNDFVFNNFKSHPLYIDVLEHVNFEFGKKYIEQIQITKEIDLIHDKKNIATNDIHGNPNMYDYGAFGMFSPTTLRYVKVASDILKLLKNNLSNKKISVVEIGVGYGGQCRILTEYFKIEKYTLIDITPALNLAKRYLETFAISSTLEFITLNEIDHIKSDLCVSNYAFSELNRSLQDRYFSKVVQHASNGYMSYNHTTEQEFNTYTVNEFAEMIPHHSEILEESPLTHPLNKILIWKS